MTEFKVDGKHGGIEVKMYPCKKAFDLTVQGNIYNPDVTQLTRPEVEELIVQLNKMLK